MNTNGHRDAHRAEQVAQHVDKAGVAAHQFFEEAKATGQGLMEAVDLRGRVDRHPYGMVAAALGVGYLLAGGLFTATTGRVFRLGIKLAAVPLVRDELLTFAESAIDGVLDKARASNLNVQPPTE